MKKIIRLTESDLTRIVKRVIKESDIWSDEDVAYNLNKWATHKINSSEIE
jgi:hypothetical protein